MKTPGAKILVTGGAGFIGSHLVDCLLSEGNTVRVVDNLVNGKPGNIDQHKGNKRFSFIKADICDSGALSAAMEGVDTVFHLACLGVRHSIRYPFRNHRVNAEGTIRVLEESRKSGVRKFVYCSSSEVYGTAVKVPMKEDHPTNPCTVYGAGKLAGEAYARAYYLTYGMKTVIVRPFNTFGPRSHHEGDAGEMIPKSIVRALSGEKILIFGDGSQTRDFTYVEDMARAIAEAAKSDKAVGRTFNIGSGFEITIRKIAEIISGSVGGGSALIENAVPRPGDVLRLYADASTYSTLTGWKPKVSFNDGLQRTIEWFKARPEGVMHLIKEERGLNWE